VGCTLHGRLHIAGTPSTRYCIGIGDILAFGIKLPGLGRSIRNKGLPVHTSQSFSLWYGQVGMGAGVGGEI
jgi:hypothetical protein